MNNSAIDDLAELIWRRVMVWDEHEATPAHRNCDTGDPDDCALFREIHDEITLWASTRTP